MRYGAVASVCNAMTRRDSALRVLFFIFDDLLGIYAARREDDSLMVIDRSIDRNWDQVDEGMIQYTVSSVATARATRLRRFGTSYAITNVTHFHARSRAGNSAEQPASADRPITHARGFNGSSDEKLLKVTRTSQLRDTIGFAPPREHKSIIGNRFFSAADHAFFRRSRNNVGR